MKEVQGKISAVQEVVRLRHKDSASKLQSWIRLLHEANTILEAAIVTYEMTYMQVRMHYSVYLNLIEAKIENLSSGSGDSIAPNPYIEVWVDSSRRARTRALWVESAPVWNQSFDVMVPQDAEELTFKLFSESKDGISDPSFLGKSDLALQNFKEKTGITTEWIPMYSRGLGAVTEASSLHAIVKYKPGSAGPNQGTLTVIVVEAKKLVEDGCDLPSPYCRMSVIDQGSEKSPPPSAASTPPVPSLHLHNNGNASSSSSAASSGLGPHAPLSFDDVSVQLDSLPSSTAGSATPSKKEKSKDKSSKSEKVQKSTVVKKNDNPHWEEGFIFKFRWDGNRSTKLLIEIHDDRQSKQSFMGFAVIPLNVVAPDPSKSSELDRWFRLKRRAGKTDLSESSTNLPQIGQLKFDIQYKEERLLPDSFYDPLFDLFQDEHRFLINFCARVAGNSSIKKELVKSIVGAFEMRNRGSWLLKSVSNAEVDETWDLSVLFRGNSVASACLDTFMRTVGRQVLDSTLRPILRELYKSNKSCELDPQRAPKGSDLKKNLAFFIESIEWIWGSIQSTIDKMPTTMRNVLAHLRARVSAKWPSDANSKYTSVTSFLFLRFFCPALMSPQSFDLVDEVPNAQMSRNLALLSKTLMNLANFIPYGNKEPNLSPLNDWLASNFGKMREYIDRLVDDPDASDVPIVQNPNATLFIYAREMNNLRDFLTQKRDKLQSEKDLVYSLSDSMRSGSHPSAVAEDSPFGHQAHVVDKHHNSDDEDDVVEDLTTGRRISVRKSFRRVSSKSRLAETLGRGPVGGLVLGKEGASDPALLSAYGELLDRTFIVLDAVNASVRSHQPAASPVSARKVLTSSSPGLILTTASGVPVTPSKQAAPISLRTDPISRHNNLDSLSTPRKRSATTKQQ